jgi:hypothetical protein
MERIAALSTGTKLMLGSGFLLFLDLFFTWQNLPQYFGTKFAVSESLDGWDRLGLVLGLLTLALLTLVILRETEVELSPDVPWNRIVVVLAALMLGVSVLKNVTDAHSAWAAYAGVVLAALVVVGAYLERDRPEPEPKPIETGNWKPRARFEPSSNAPQSRTTGPETDSRTAEPARRW